MKRAARLLGGGSIYDLQQLLGHGSIKTTEIYLDFLTPDEKPRAKAVIRRANLALTQF